jgi:pimeloyl-ACP methyl ester carboxylesterase
MRRGWFVILLALSLAACGDPREAANRMAGQAGFTATNIQTTPFRLRAYRRAARAETLRIYIEGDGHAWRTIDTPSDDPTPWAPIALDLATRDPDQAVAYLARPCQYVRDDPACDVSDWTGSRYSEAVVGSMNQALDSLKRDAGAQRLDLVGFSGGGAIAALIAMRRADVVSLRTVAANLDTAAWTEAHGISPLTGSLNPADTAKLLANLPQVHFVGAEDSNVGLSVTRAFVQRIGPSRCVRVQVEPGLEHTGDWAARWPALLGVTPVCETGPGR